MKVRKDLKEKYSKQYYSDNNEVWRKLGAKGKANNIINITGNQSFQSVVDVGAGSGSVIEMLDARNFATTFTALEISESAMIQIKKKTFKSPVNPTLFDGYKIPFDDNEFDLAICSHVIEHIEFPRLLLRELRRVSKRQVFEVPIDFSIHVDKKFEHFNAYGHINIYTPGLFNFLLKTEGFKILRSKCSLYEMEVINHLFKNDKVALYKNLLKRAIWNFVPYLKQIKPNAYTVYTE